MRLSKLRQALLDAEAMLLEQAYRKQKKAQNKTFVPGGVLRANILAAVTLEYLKYVHNDRHASRVQTARENFKV